MNPDNDVVDAEFALPPDRVSQLQQEIIVRVKAIQEQKKDKKLIVASYNDTIKTLEVERDQLVLELDTLKSQEKEKMLLEKADKFLATAPDNSSATEELNIL
jgi:cytochrome c-type biogenesis protein CcmH/NrfG